MASAATTSTNERDVVVASVRGEGPKALVDRAQTLRFVFHDFKGLPQEREDWVTTPPLEAFGYLWELKLYPRGCIEYGYPGIDPDALADISVSLKYIGGDEKYTPSASIVIRCKEYELLIREDDDVYSSDGTWGDMRFLEREDVLDNLLEDDGSLIIEVDIRITVDSNTTTIMASAATTNTTGRDVVGTATVGENPKRLMDHTQTLRFVYPDFRATGTHFLRDDMVLSLLLEAFGYSWRLKLYPKGSLNSDTDTEYLSVYFKYQGDKKDTPTARCTFRSKEYEKPMATHVFRKGRGRGLHNYLKREDVLERYLEDDGSLIIEVDIQITVDSKRVWYPKKIPTDASLKESYSEGLPSLATEEEIENDTTDVVFIVNYCEFPVHKSILQLHAKPLFALYNGEDRFDSDAYDDVGRAHVHDDVGRAHVYDDIGRRHVHIPGININTFEKVVEFIYTVNTTPTLVGAVSAIKLLLAAHRFDCVSLKLYVESVLVDKFVTPTNAASMLLLGDTYHCALLKEAALYSSFADPTLFRESSSDPAAAAAWSKIQDSRRLQSELYVYGKNALMASRNPNTAVFGFVRAFTNTNAGIVEGEDDTTRTMDVRTLRERLEEVNLGLDGSREMLVTRFRDNHEQEHRIIRRHREQMVATSVCVICLDVRPDIATLCCGQPVHHNCAATWLLKSPTCMYCRAAFPPSQEGERLQQHQEEQLRVKITGLVLTNDRLRRPVYFEASMRDGYPGTLPCRDGTFDDVTGDDTAVWNVRFDQFADTNTDFLPYPDGTGDDFELRLSGNYVFGFDETTCVYKYGRNNRTPRGETPRWRDVGFGISGSGNLSAIVFFRIGPISYRDFMALFPKRQSIGISELMRRLKAKRHNYEMKLDSVAFPLFRIISLLAILQSMGISTVE